MMSNEAIDYKLAAEQLRTGKPLFGKDGALAPMLERILSAEEEVAKELQVVGRKTNVAHSPYSLTTGP